MPGGNLQGRKRDGAEAGPRNLSPGKYVWDGFWDRLPETRQRYVRSQYATYIVGCRQVVRHWFLVPAFGGSNPSIPAMKNRVHLGSFFHAEIGIQTPECTFGGERCQWHRESDVPLTIDLQTRTRGVAERDRIPPSQPRKRTSICSSFFLSRVWKNLNRRVGIQG